MKNSDMKIIAIILSIALFLTIVTSNAVSIASVVFLAKDAATAQEGTVDASGDATGTDANATNTNTSTGSTGGTSTDANASTSTDASASTGTDANASTGTDASASTGTDASASTGTDANAGADATGLKALTDAEALAMFQKASKEVHEKGAAGYKKIGWQAVEGELQLSKFSFLAGTLTNLISGFMTEESEAEVKDNAKGSDDAKNRMPAGDCSKSYIKSSKATVEGDYYIITIVMNDQVNPSYDDTDGLVKMSREFLDIKDVQETVQTDATVSKVVSKLDGTINYKTYTITAKMTADGKFVEITHYGVGDINADLTAVGIGDLSASGSLSFNAKYYDFVY